MGLYEIIKQLKPKLIHNKYTKQFITIFISIKMHAMSILLKLNLININIFILVYILFILNQIYLLEIANYKNVLTYFK